MSASINEAVISGKLEEVKLRLDLGEDVNQKVYPKFSAPLHDAIICGQTDIALLLIERGANVNIVDYRGLTPRQLAKRYQQPEIDEILISKGAQLEASDCQSEERSAQMEDILPPWRRKVSKA